MVYCSPAWKTREVEDSPVRLYVTVYEVMTPLGMAGGSQDSMTNLEPIISATKLMGGLAGTGNIINLNRIPDGEKKSGLT